ncbi:hypothetical protein [Marinobacter sp.]|uniref:hypothetical protein n=1 Tax=Marinobacter sp. TaxID=50741 RepID=UPI0034A2ECDA
MEKVNYRLALWPFFTGVMFIFLGICLNKGLGLTSLGVNTTFIGLGIVFTAMALALFIWLKWLIGR